MPPVRRPGGRGFALVITVSLLVLLALVAVGVLTLAGITVRGSSVGAAGAEARTNARLALMVALGELQKHAGPDQRVTANAAILDEAPESAEAAGVANPHWLGAWDSWAAGRQSFGNDAASEHRTIHRARNRGMSPSYEEGREDHFRSWLVSLAGTAAESLDSARSLKLDGVPHPDGDSSGVRMVGRGSLGETADERQFVTAGLREVGPGGPGGGRYAWWVADESMKACILPPVEENDDASESADLIARAQGAETTGHPVIDGLDALSEASVLERIHSRPSMEIGAADRDTVRGTFHAVTPYSLGLMTDVREGGMKRDLNALLERPIEERDDGDEFMLYRLDNGDDARVPIQDLAAYYQSYREVVTYSNRRSGNRHAGNTLQVNNVDFKSGHESIPGKVGTPERSFVREYTNLYRMPFPVKVQFLLSYIGVPRERGRINRQNPDRYKLHIGMTPALTMWNPYNVPLVLNVGADQATQLRLFNIPFGLTWAKNGGRFRSPKPNSLVWITNRNWEGGDRDNGLTLYVGGTKHHVIFQPGEVRTFSLNQTRIAGNIEGIINSNVYRPELEAAPGWDPNSFIELPRSEKGNDRRNVEIEFPNAGSDRRKKDGGALTFNGADTIGLTVTAAINEDMANGAAFHFFHRQSSTMTGGINAGEDRAHMRRQFQFTSRLHTDQQYKRDNRFNESLMSDGFPRGAGEIRIPPVKGSELIGRHRPFLLVSMAAGCEVSQDVAGETTGRRYVSRPFLHSTPVQTVTWIDRDDRDAHYFHGWNWWVQPINSVLEAQVQVAPNNRSGYWGGGYTPDFGVTNVVQQEVPVAPIHAIAALSHAQLSGYSITSDNLGTNYTGRQGNFEGTTATGGNGLFPRTCQAVGNSYAHPYLSRHEAFGTWTRHFSVTEGARNVPFADHSYLANKALWDDYFFSSIAPHQTPLFGKTGKATARELAERFFRGAAPLPNPRFVPYGEGDHEERLRKLFAGDRMTPEGADRIASMLMVRGPFNVNSTSVDAWRALLASLRGRAVAYLPTNDNSNLLGRGVPIKPAVPDEGHTVVPGTTLGNGEFVANSTSDPADPEQWYCWRSLSDEEIGQLAVAMVEQVKRRGPFLSLSEFVNRRLDRGDADLSVKGALQAALDDEDVEINAGFRDPARTISTDEFGGMRPKFPEALTGPVAYGSPAYVDQADILRGLGGQLSPRGDTFLVRAYGDSVAPDGRVMARAWCEAVVQRVPDLVDPAADETHEPFAALGSQVNQTFGRRFRLVAFRWLGAGEV